MSELSLVDVTLRYQHREPVLSNVDLQVASGEILVLVGRSGCGKSTLLRALAGLLAPATGRIAVDGTPVTGTNANRALVFQDDGLLPWRSVARNVELPLAIRGEDRASRRAAVEQWLAEVGLAGDENRLPHQLSGGMRQRVQLARKLAGRPGVILADEPFGALDAQTRADMQRLLVRVWREHPTTIVFVTHDVDEALYLGDRVAVLADGGVKSIVDSPDPRAEQADPARVAARAHILAELGAQVAA